MQIACKRYGCMKAVEVCYWSCKYRRNCRDWKGALEADPGIEAIRVRLEESATKTGRVFDPNTLIQPARMSYARAAPLSLSAPGRLRSGNGVTTRSSDRRESEPPQLSTRSKTANRKTIKKEQPEEMAKQTTEESQTTPESKTSTTEAAKPKRSKTKRPAKRAKQAAKGTVYLLLFKNGKYKELREADLTIEASHVLKNPSLRLVKGQLLIPEITLRPVGE